MSTSTLERAPQDALGAPSPGMRRFLQAVIVLGALVVLVAGGFAWGSHTVGSAAPASAVDVGFAEDMTAHHQQAIDMAAYARDTSTDADVVHAAYDIETNQSIELGEMTGWLDT